MSDDLQALVTMRVQLYQFIESTGQYDDKGQLGCCIVGTAPAPPAHPMYRLSCYTDDGTYICHAAITPNNDTGAQLILQGNGYCCFVDDEKNHYSMQFASEDEVRTFAANYTVAMYAVSNQPTHNIVSCDVAMGNDDKTVKVGDRVKVRYTQWVVQRSGQVGELPRLGSPLESNESLDKPYVFTVPTSHNAVQRDMKGFEGCVVGMGEEGRRLIIVPQKIRKGSGPDVNICFLLTLVKRKEEGVAAGRPEENTQQNPNQLGAMLLGAPPQTQQSLQNQYQLQVGGQQMQMGGMVPYQPQEQYIAPAPPKPKVEGPPPLPPGMSPEQLAAIDKARDQVAALMAAVKDAASKLDLFAHDYKQHQSNQRPTSLANVQLKHSVDHIIQETDRLKKDIHEKDAELKKLEEKNKDLQRKADKFSVTASQLNEEKKKALISSNDSKLDADRQLLSLQNQVTLTLSEREDLSRHLSTVKKLLEVADRETKEGKGTLQALDIKVSTAEAKISTGEENLQEERSRRKALEVKCATLGDELRTLIEEVRSKDSQIDEKRRRGDNDRLHFMRLQEDEREQATKEINALREELVMELAARDRRFQEERARVATDNFERGRQHGIDEGTAEAHIEWDARIHELQSQVQRARNDTETQRVKHRQVAEQAAADERRLMTHLDTLRQTREQMQEKAADIENELHAANLARMEVEEEALAALRKALQNLSRPAAKRDLLYTIHQARAKEAIDYSFEAVRAAEEEQREQEDKAAFLQWLRKEMSDEADGSPPPALRTKWEEDRTPLPPPPPEPEPEPVFEPEPEPEPEVEAEAEDEPWKREGDGYGGDGQRPDDYPEEEPEMAAKSDAEAEEGEEADDAKYTAADYERDRQAAPTTAAAPESDAPTPRAASETQEETQEEAQEEAAPARAETPAEASEASEHDAVPHIAAPAAAPAASSSLFADEETEEESFVAAPRPPAKAPAVPATFAADSEEEEVLAPARPVVPAKPAAPASGKRSMFDSEGSGSDEDIVIPGQQRQEKRAMSRPAAATASTAAPVAQKKLKKSAFDSSSEEESDAVVSASPLGGSRPRPATAAPKRAPPTRNMFADSSEEEEAPPVRAAPKAAPKVVAAPAAVKSGGGGMFDTDTEEDVPPPKRPAAAQKPRGAVPPPKKKMFASSSEED